jgi:hypothetical protein
MTKQELKNQIGEIENQLQYVYDQGEQKTMKRQIRKLKKQIKAMTPEMGEGVTLTAQDFADNLSYSGKKDTPEKTFFKEESRRYDEQELEIIKKMAYYEQGIYDYFNKKYRPIPGTIKRIVLAEHKEDVKSSNIYDRMCAKSSAEVRYEFQILPGYNKEPMTIIKEVKENTTLSMSDVRAFM